MPQMQMPEIEQGDGGFPVPSLTGWQIQVAALPSRGAAQALLDKIGALVRTVHTGALAQIEPTTRSGRTLYRARFEGFEDQAAATRACAVLKSNKLDCITIEVP
jgi:D-alanyl-D-alanine carboxypeptidase/D-alanyl-D-alanine carboxypeptidase (penicillin-binding protein 5/6)